MNVSKGFCLLSLMLLATARSGIAQSYGEPDRDAPGDALIQHYLAKEAEELHAEFLDSVDDLDDWNAHQETYRREYLHMLGLWPLPERTPLESTVTGTLAGEGFQVDMLHFQSMPGLYVTANLYRPEHVEPGDKLPAVLYVCGHSHRGRNGNKTAFQSHGIWFARHGYVCLVLDTLQLGEIAALHHGTYRENRWWWHSRGYTPAGVECWNGVRGIDYLVSRDDVDAERIAVTGISGGGAATFWIAAADPRVAVAVPVSGMADLPSYLSNRVINGHCDCMFLYNTFAWPWVRIAALIAPRPLLFVNSDEDPIFPMDANERLINRLEMVYRLYGAGDQVDSVVSVGGHAYRKDIRQAAYRFINSHLKGDPSPVHDSEVDLVMEDDGELRHPVNPEKLRVFPTDADIPKEERNTTIDEHFVPMAKVAVPETGAFESWKERFVQDLRETSFAWLPESIPAAKPIDDGRFETERGIEITLNRASAADTPNDNGNVILVVDVSEDGEALGEELESMISKDALVYRCAPRGVGATRWTRKNPPNYVERSFALLGRTVDAGRVWDVVAAARHLKETHPEHDLQVMGQGGAGILAAYAALLDPSIDLVAVSEPPASHMEASAPQILNVLRVCDVPELLGMLAPKTLTLRECPEPALSKVKAVYAAADASDRLKID